MASHRNNVPNLQANGNIYPSRFVKLDSTGDNLVLQCGANQPAIGISQQGAKYPATSPSGLLGSPLYAAEDGDTIMIFGLGDVCPIEAGGTVTAGDLLESDANGKAVTSGAGRNYSAVALESATSGQLLRCQIILEREPLDEVVTATNVITAAESGKTFFLNSTTEFVSTLPAPALGLRYKFIVTGAPSGASYTIVTTSGANIMFGMMLERNGTAGVAGSQEDTITFVDGQSIVGDWIEFVSDGTNWYYHGMTDVAAGSTATAS